MRTYEMKLAADEIVADAADGTWAPAHSCAWVRYEDAMAEIDRLRKDADRYRWLRDQPWGELFYYDSDGEHRKHFCNSISAGNQLDAAIDTAMLFDA